MSPAGREKIDGCRLRFWNGRSDEQVLLHREARFCRMQCFQALSVSLDGLILLLRCCGRRYMVLGLGRLCKDNDLQAGTTGGTCPCRRLSRRCFWGFVKAGVMGKTGGKWKPTVRVRVKADGRSSGNVEKMWTACWSIRTSDPRWRTFLRSKARG